MRKQCGSTVLTGVLFVIAMFFAFPVTAYGKTGEVNSNTGYEVLIDDDADLLTSEEELQLAEKMAEVTVYGHAAFVTVDYNTTSAGDFAEDYFYGNFGYESGTLFLIDMDNREIYIYSDGEVYKIVTKSYANTITDNIYTYASDEEYYTCAYKAFEQIVSLLEGNKIAQPMKHISNAFLALLLALLINYILVMCMSAAKKPGKRELLEATKHRCSLVNTKAVYTHTTKKYDPPSSSSGGGGRSGGGGGGGGGGGHSF